MIALQSLIERAARLNPSGVATTYKGTYLTWAATEQRVASLASGLQHLGLSEGDRVGILSLNCATYYEALFAVPWAGFCVVPLNTRWAVPENNYAIGDSGTRAVLFDDAFSAQVEELRSALVCLEHCIYIGEGTCPDWAIDAEVIINEQSPCTPSTRGGNEMAGIFYTGGTTGFPKGVMQSHSAIWASGMGSLPMFGMTRESRYLHVAPMFHMADFAGGMGATLSAAQNVVLQSFDPVAVMATVAEQKITHALLVPAMIKMLLDHPDIAAADFSSMEKIIYGASPMPAATLQRCMELWPHIGMVQAYGQTELAPVATMLSPEDHRRGGQILKSAGRPTPINDIRVLDDDDNDCAIGVSGEVVVRGPHTMLGYWNKPEETAKALQNGWVYTGDAGIFDDEGYLYIVDRLKDMVVTGGENVFTTEVENVLISHAAIQDVSVIGIPHDEWGEAVHAIVILHPSRTATEEELVAQCRASIAGYKVPKGFTFRAEPMPLSGAGKVLKTQLRRPFWEGRDRQVN